MIDDRTLGRVLPHGAVQLLGDLIRAVLWMLLVVGWLSYAAVYVRLGGLLLAKPGPNDFTIFYYTARMVADGHDMYGALPRSYGLEWKGTHLGNLNPPQFQLLMRPLVPLGYRGALIAWMSLSVLSTIVAAWLAFRELRSIPTRKQILVGGLVVFSSAAWTSVAVTGEMSLLLLVPFTAAWIAARRERWFLAGVLVGVCASFKLFFCVFGAWFLVARRWSACAGLLLGAAACTAAGVMAYGVDAYAAWVHGFSLVGWWWLTMNVSLRGLAERLLNPGPPFVPVLRAAAAAKPLWMALSLAVVIVTARRLWPRAEGVDPDRLFPALLVAALLISPLGWVYYLPLATLPLVALVMRGELPGRGWFNVTVFALALAWLWVPMEVTEKGQPSRVATMLLACAHNWGALLLWLALIWRHDGERALESAR